MKRDLGTQLLVGIHMLLTVWALLFACSLFLADSGTSADILAVGNIVFLFLDIPLSVWTLILRKKGRIRKSSSAIAAVLAVTNTVIGIGAWYFLIRFLLA